MSCNSVSSFNDEYPFIETWLEPAGHGVLIKMLQENYGNMCFNFRESGQLHIKSIKMGVQNEGQYCIDEDFVLTLDQVQATVVKNDGSTYEMYIEWGLLEERMQIQFCESFEFPLEMNSGYSIKEKKKQLAC